MIDEPQVTKTEAQAAAVIHIVVPRDQIQEVMGPAFGEVNAVLAAQGVAPAGPFFDHHLRMDSDVFDFEVGVPVAAPFAPSGRVIAGELPAATIARTIYHGDYGGLGDAWGEFGVWIERAGLKPAWDLWQRYVVGPESGPDPAGWQTELNRPLLS